MTDSTPAKSLGDAAFNAKLQDLRKTDNVTNFYYIARTYLFLAAVIGGAVAFDLWRQAEGWPWPASAPVFFAAAVLVGAGQHHLSGLAHEGTHHILFRNRALNELASDVFCMFPLLSSTYRFRLQHLAHHQFVNDPVRDPDMAQLRESGHELAFPMEKAAARRALLRQLRPARLVRYMLARAAYGATGTGTTNPYALAGGRPAKLAVRVGLAVLLTQVIAVGAAVATGEPVWLAVAAPALYAASAVALAALPPSAYTQTRVRPVFALRWLGLMRITFIVAVIHAVGWAQLLTGAPAGVYAALLWLVPIFTSYSFFMGLRQTVQHGNGDRGRLTNSRVFAIGRPLHAAVFPVGQDFHMPHHLYATVPHYRLKQLHAELMNYPEYRADAVEVHGYFRPPAGPAANPTVLDVLGPAYAARAARDPHIDNSVLNDDQVDGRAELEREATASAISAGWSGRKAA